MSESESEVSQHEEEEIDEEDRLKIRERLSTMSFEDLQKLKETMGSKVYNATLFGASQEKKKTKFKRLNKNRPREMSSRRSFKLENNVISAKKHIPRDPRFDPLCGTFDNNTFKKNYKFVNELRKKESTILEKELQETANPTDKKKIKLAVQGLKNKIREHEAHEKQKQKAIEEKKEFRQKAKHGEKPNFKKKSVKRLEDLIGKYEELKKTNKLQKHIEKRSKKLATKDRKEKQKLFSSP